MNLAQIWIWNLDPLCAPRPETLTGGARRLAGARVARVRDDWALGVYDWWAWGARGLIGKKGEDKASAGIELAARCSRRRLAATGLARWFCLDLGLAPFELLLRANPHTDETELKTCPRRRQSHGGANRRRRPGFGGAVEACVRARAPGRGA